MKTSSDDFAEAQADQLKIHKIYRIAQTDRHELVSEVIQSIDKELARIVDAQRKMEPDLRKGTKAYKEREREHKESELEPLIRYKNALRNDRFVWQGRAAERRKRYEKYQQNMKNTTNIVIAKIRSLLKSECVDTLREHVDIGIIRYAITQIIEDAVQNSDDDDSNNLDCSFCDIAFVADRFKRKHRDEMHTPKIVQYVMRHLRIDEFN